MEPQQNNSQPPYQRAPMLSTPIAIIIAGIIVAVAVFGGLKYQGNAGPAAAGAPAPAKKVNVKDVKITADDPFIGNANAKVTLVYWSDYQCPFCKAVETGGIPQITIGASIPTLIKDYVDTGKLKIVFKDYPFLGQDSIGAALYEHAIWEKYPEKFYTWREKMFKAQDAEGDEGFGDEASILKLIATIPGMDGKAIQLLVNQKKDQYQKLIDADRAEGATFGIQGTPGFITGTTLIDGAQPLANFKAAIDPQL